MSEHKEYKIIDENETMSEEIVDEIEERMKRLSESEKDENEFNDNYDIEDIDGAGVC